VFLAHDTQGGRRPQPLMSANDIRHKKNLRKKARFSHIVTQEEFVMIKRSGVEELKKESLTPMKRAKPIKNDMPIHRMYPF